MTALLASAPLLLLPLHGPHAGAPHDAQPPGAQASPAPRAPAEEWIYYDYVDAGGELRGGRVRVDGRNPLHGVTVHAPVFPPSFASSAVTLVDNGDPANRLDLVFVGDGYTPGELGLFADHVDDILPTFLSEPPLDAYATYVNVHRVDVVSPESGVDNDPVQGVAKDTALDMEYWCGGTERLLCVNVGKAKLQAGFAPGADQVLALANSTKYGGAGYPGSDLATLAGDNGSSIEIALHEVGHSLGNLADEYTYGGPTTYVGPEPSGANLSKKDSAAMSSAAAKWHLWLGEAGVGTFEGGGYSLLGIFRPTNNSLMRNLGRPFEEVNSEQLVVELYKIVDPIDAATPPGTYTDADVLEVTPMAPPGHALTVQWALDGAPLPGATGTSLDLATLGLADGLHEVSVTVVDPTDLVRDPALRAEHLTQTMTWTVAAGDDPPPFLFAAAPASSWTTDPVELTGGFLDSVLAARIGGDPAVIVEQSFDSLRLQRTVPSAPGWNDVELDTLAGTTVVPAHVEMLPSQAASTTGVGGALDTRLHLTDFEPGAYATLYGLGTYPVPVPLPGIHHGLELDLGAPWGFLAGGVLPVGPLEQSFPVPASPGLQGVTLHVQSWAQHGNWIFEVQSFSNRVSVVL